MAATNQKKHNEIKKTNWHYYLRSNISNRIFYLFNNLYNYRIMNQQTKVILGFLAACILAALSNNLFN